MVMLLASLENLKGHDNEADFLGFLQKLVPHRSLTLPFEPFRFWLRIREDILNQKTTPRLGNFPTRRVVFQLRIPYLREFEGKVGTSRNVV
jgi:hypothetical protein